MILNLPIHQNLVFHQNFKALRVDVYLLFSSWLVTLRVNLKNYICYVPRHHMWHATHQLTLNIDLLNVVIREQTKTTALLPSPFSPQGMRMARVSLIWTDAHTVHQSHWHLPGRIIAHPSRCSLKHAKLNHGTFGTHLPIPFIICPMNTKLKKILQ